MLLDTGTETKVRPLSVKQNCTKIRIIGALVKSQLQGLDHSCVDDVGFRPSQAQVQQAAVTLQ